MPNPLLPRTRHATWIAALGLVAGVHVGVLAHRLLHDAFAPEQPSSTIVVGSVIHEAPSFVVAQPEPLPRRLAHCRDQHVCVIDRDALADAFVRRDARLLRSVRAEPVEGGLELSGIRRQGLLGVVGLRNGDVLTAVDEHPLRDGGDVEVLLAHAQQGSFRIAFRREGRVLTKRFELIDGAAFRTAREEGRPA